MTVYKHETKRTNSYSSPFNYNRFDRLLFAPFFFAILCIFLFNRLAATSFFLYLPPHSMRSYRVPTNLFLLLLVVLLLYIYICSYLTFVRDETRRDDHNYSIDSSACTHKIKQTKHVGREHFSIFHSRNNKNHL